MIRTLRLSGFALVLLAGSALGDATGYKPHATGFTLPNAQQAVSATLAQTANYATTAGSTGYATNAGTATTAASATYATSSGSAITAASATNATNAAYATNAGSANDANYATNAAVASQAAGLTAGNNCPAGTALSVTKGVLGCVSSVTSITGQLNGAQIVGDLTNVGNIYANGYVAGRNGLYSDTGVYSAVYADRGADSNATFLGNAVSANSAGSANYATSAASAGSVTGTVNGAQIVGDLTNVGNVYANGYVAARQSLYSDGGVYSNGYAARNGSGTAAFYGNASSSSAAATVTGQVNGAQIVGDLTNVGNIYANGYVAAKQSLYSDGAVYSNGYAARNGTGTAAFYGNASSSNAATTVTGQVNGAQIVGNLNVGSINASGNIVSTNGYVYGVTGLFTDNAVFSNTYASRSGGSNAVFNGNATSATTASSANTANTASTVTGPVNGAQIFGNLDIGSINASGNIVSTNGYVYGVTGLFTDNAVFSNTYASRSGGSNAVFNGNAISATTASSANSANTANYATTAGSASYAANSVVGILHQNVAGDGSSYYCDSGYHLVFYDTNVNSTNNAFFYECIQNGH